MSDSEVHFRPSQYWPAEHPGHPGRQPLRRELRRRHLGREEPLGVLRHRRQARLRRRRRHAHPDRLRRRPGRADLPDERGQRGEPDPQRCARRHRVLPQHHDGLEHVRPRRRCPRRLPRRRRVRRPHLQQRRVRARRPVVGRPAGHSNVSHGCINLSTERAAWFFNFSQPGRRRRGQELRSARRCPPPTATSTTGPSRGPTGRPAAR